MVIEYVRRRDGQAVFYLRLRDVMTKASVEGIVCPFCVTYGNHVYCVERMVQDAEI